MVEDIWSKLYFEARKVQNSRVISPFIEAGVCHTEYGYQKVKREFLVASKTRKVVYVLYRIKHRRPFSLPSLTSYIAYLVRSLHSICSLL